MPHDLASDPTKTVFEYARDRLAAQGLGPLARPGPRPGRSTSSTATASTRCVEHWSLRGLERGQPRGVLVRHAATSTSGCTTSPPPPSARSTTGCASAARRRPRPAGSRSCSRTPSASGVAGRLRHHAHLRQPAAGLPADRWSATAARAPRSGGPSGASPRRTSTRSATRCSPGPSCCAGWRRAWAGSRRCPTGWSPTTSRSSAGRRRCCTAASACAPSASCASRAGGRCALLERLRRPRLGRRRSTGDGGRLAGGGARRRRPSDGAVGGAGLEPHARPDQGGRLGRPGPTGRHRRGRRPRARGVVRRPPRPRRRRPLQHRGGLGPAQGRRPGLADRRAVGAAARGRPARAARPRRDRSPPTTTARVEVTFDLPMPAMSFLAVRGLSGRSSPSPRWFVPGGRGCRPSGRAVARVVELVGGRAARPLPGGLDTRRRRLRRCSTTRWFVPGGRACRPGGRACRDHSWTTPGATCGAAPPHRPRARVGCSGARHRRPADLPRTRGAGGRGGGARRPGAAGPDPDGRGGRAGDDAATSTCSSRPAPAPASRWATSSPRCSTTGGSWSPPPPSPCSTSSSSATSRRCSRPPTTCCDSEADVRRAQGPLQLRLPAPDPRGRPRRPGHPGRPARGVDGQRGARAARVGRGGDRGRGARRPRLRAQAHRPGLAAGLGQPPRVPGRGQVPVRRRVLRRARQGEGRRSPS